MNRPLVIVAIGWTLGILLAASLDLDAPVIPVLLFLAAIGAAYWARRRPRLRALAAAACFFAVGAWLYAMRHTDAADDVFCQSIKDQSGGVLTLEGTITQANLVLPGSDYTSFTLAVDHFGLQRAETSAYGRTLVRWKGATAPVFVGDYVRVRGNAATTLGRVNPGVNGVEDYYRRLGAHSVVYARDAASVTRLREGAWWLPGYWTSRLRVSLAAQFNQLAPPEVVPFVCAVWLGDRGGISQDEYQSYVETGTAHILSVSGVHIGIVYVSIVLLLSVFLAPGRIRALLTIVAVAGFVFMSGASVPSLRAGLMVGLYVAAELLDREPDAPSALGAAAILLSGWNPDLLFDTGFQLSFLSVASLLLFREPFDRLLRFIPRHVRGLVSTALAVQLLPLPVAIAAFHVFTFAAPVANLIVVPLLTAVLWLCLAFSLTAPWSPFFGEIFGYALLPLVSAIRETAAWTRLAVNRPSPTWIAVLCYLGALAVAHRACRPNTSRRLSLAGCAAILVVGAFLSWKPWWVQPEVVILDVGHGSAAFVQAADGSTALIDTGDRQDRLDYGARVIAPFVWARGLTRLDYLIISHPDRDHIGGADYLVTHLDVGEVVLGRDSGQPLDAGLVGLCAQRGIPVRRVVQGDVLGLGDARFTILHPPGDWRSSASDNDSSLVVRLDWEGRRLLFPGDIELAGEQAVARTDCRADVLIVPHHGSKTSSSPAFIHAIDPRFALVSTGGTSSREGAAGLILERYRAEGIRVWRTDYSGGIRIVPSASSLAVQGTREARGYPIPADSRDVSAP